MRKVLVTGANGHLGSTLVKALLRRGYSVRGSVRNAKEVARQGILNGGPRRLTFAMIADYFQGSQLRYFDTGKIRRELGRQARPLEASIRDTVD